MSYRNRRATASPSNTTASGSRKSNRMVSRITGSQDQLLDYLRLALLTYEKEVSDPRLLLAVRHLIAAIQMERPTMTLQ
jgi:hypothetical protein